MKLDIKRKLRLVIGGLAWMTSLFNVRDVAQGEVETLKVRLEVSEHEKQELLQRSPRKLRCASIQFPPLSHSLSPISPHFKFHSMQTVQTQTPLPYVEWNEVHHTHDATPPAPLSPPELTAPVAVRY